MADIMFESPRNDSLAAIESSGMQTSAPSIEMVPNLAFSFPMRAPESTRRPASMLLAPSPTISQPHKRTASALPTFTFNASDTSGRAGTTPPQTPDEVTTGGLGTPVRKGHRRGGSEFVGGDSRLGMNSAITSSPTKADAPTLPITMAPPSGRRAHAHRRSVAVSSHDLSQIMTAGDRSPKLSGSLPTDSDMPPMPLAPLATFLSAEDSLRPQIEGSPTRPPSRVRVEFVEQVEIIPRPLSTISSETESSVSTVTGHSVSNSISSVLSLRTPAHARVSSAGFNNLGSIAEPRTQPDTNKRLSKEGDWLRHRPVSQGSQQSTAADAASSAAGPLFGEDLTFPRQRHQGRSQAAGPQRRQSEPLISLMAGSITNSVSSLPEAAPHELMRTSTSDKRSSGQKLKQWALSKLQRRHRDGRPQTAPVTGPGSRPESAGYVDVPKPASPLRSTVAETDLDAVFGGDSVESSPSRYGRSPTQMTFERPSPVLDGRHQDMDDDATPMLDLDAALGSTALKASAPNAHRRHMHSDRPSSANNFLHRRAESEPVLMAFNYNRVGSTPTKSMEDVFEEDEDDAAPVTEAGMGITMVDADRSAFDPANLERRRVRRVARDLDRPFTSYITPSTSLTIPATLARPASIVEDIIAEESSPIEIVEAHEEPRAASLEKSSDSSEVSTLLAAPIFAQADEREGFSTPETFNESSFSSPDFSRRQGSFEASRIGTSASSLADTRTTTSCTTSGEAGHEARISVDDVPSLTSSRSTMMSTIHTELGRRSISESRIYEAMPRRVDAEQLAARRKKRASIQSLSQLVGGTFGNARTRTHDDSRPQTANLLDAHTAGAKSTKKKEHRLKKLMFWRSKQNLRQAAKDDAALEL